MFNVPEKYRVNDGHLASDKRFGNNGLFHISRAVKRNNVNFRCIASDGEGWEHVSITIRNKQRCATWQEMCFIKAIFWDISDCVIQYHPKENDYISFHEHCLHLWRPINEKFPTPPSYMVGPKNK